jgi:hypothetical protein
VADRPLRPATDRRLGRPLPHQQANRTQATPKAPHGFGPQAICGISPSFPGLSPTSGHIPTRYSPVRHSPCRACDLHVLSIPPAFALSQDQTLRFIHPTKPESPADESQPSSPKPDAGHTPTQAQQQPPGTKAPHDQHPPVSLSANQQRRPRIPPHRPKTAKQDKAQAPATHRQNSNQNISSQTEHASKTRCSFQRNELPRGRP